MATWRTYPVGRQASVGLPPTWRDLTQKTPAVKAAIRAEAARHPRVAPILYAFMSRMGPLVKLIAADFARASLKSGFVTNLNVLRQRTRFSLEAWAKANADALGHYPGVVKPVRRRYVHLPAGLAIRFRYAQRVQAGTWRRVSVTQYAVAHAGAVYLLTYTTTPAQVRAYTPVFAQSARSLRFR